MTRYGRHNAQKSVAPTSASAVTASVEDTAVLRAPCTGLVPCGVQYKSILSSQNWADRFRLGSYSRYRLLADQVPYAPFNRQTIYDFDWRCQHSLIWNKLFKLGVILASDAYDRVEYAPRGTRARRTRDGPVMGRHLGIIKWSSRHNGEHIRKKLKNGEHTGL